MSYLRIFMFFFSVLWAKEALADNFEQFFKISFEGQNFALADTQNSQKQRGASLSLAKRAFKTELFKETSPNNLNNTLNLQNQKFTSQNAWHIPQFLTSPAKQNTSQNFQSAQNLNLKKTQNVAKVQNHKNSLNFIDSLVAQNFRAQPNVLATANDLPKEKAPQDELFLACLAEVYPELKVVKTKEGIFLQIGSDTFIPYATMLRKADSLLDVAVRQSLLVPYELEPRRVPTPQGYAPGRLRSYDLFSALYGSEKSLVQKNLVQVKALGQSWTLHKKVAQAFLRVSQRLEQAVLKDPSLKPWLKGAGSYKWRKIAGESVLSAHAFGIALDLGVRAGATYWRWCKLRPHPLQRSYPSAIVSAFEAEGFIWGGKWHEYDLMHFEYRPELICVAKKRAKQTLPNYRHGFAPTQPKDQR